MAVSPGVGPFGVAKATFYEKALNKQAVSNYL
jgi:hypothetical protein